MAEQCVVPRRHARRGARRGVIGERVQRATAAGAELRQRRLLAVAEVVRRSAHAAQKPDRVVLRAPRARRQARRVAVRRHVGAHRAPKLVIRHAAPEDKGGARDIVTGCRRGDDGAERRLAPKHLVVRVRPARKAVRLERDAGRCRRRRRAQRRGRDDAHDVEVVVRRVAQLHVDAVHLARVGAPRREQTRERPCENVGGARREAEDEARRAPRVHVDVLCLCIRQQLDAAEVVGGALHARLEHLELG